MSLKTKNKIKVDQSEYPHLSSSKVSFSISEAADLCLVEPHVLRYWEKQFDTFKPQKINGRRYFSRKDILAIRQIRSLLYIKNFTIEGAKAQLANSYDSQVLDNKEIIKIIIANLEDVLKNLSAN